MKFLFFTLLIMTWPSTGKSGWLLTGSLSVDAFSFNSKNQTDTINYYGFGPDLLLGYSFYKKVSLSTFIKDSSAAAASFEWNKKYRNVDLLSYGGELGFKLGKDVFLAFRGGSTTYSLLKSYGKDYETPGKWTGPAGSIILGATYQMSKESALQVALEVTHVNVSREQVKRQLDSITLKMGLSLDDFIHLIFNGPLFKHLFK